MRVGNKTFTFRHVPNFKNEIKIGRTKKQTIKNIETKIPRTKGEFNA